VAGAAADNEERKRVEKALELRERLEALLEELSPEARGEFERLWAERLRAEAELAPASSTVIESEAAAPSAPEPVPAQGEAAPEPGVGVEPQLPVREASETPAPAEAAQSEAQTVPSEEPPRQRDSPVSGPSPATPPAPRPLEPVPGPAPDPAAPREHTCNTLYVLDSNGDGFVSGADRFWRYLGLWSDNGDGLLTDDEVQTLFKLRIRKVSARLYSYTTVKDVDGGVWLEDRIYFDLPGKGRQSRATLTINAGGLARSDDFWLEDGEGNRLEGLIAIESGVAVVSATTGRHPILCR
jgi:hypothetical protein